MRSKQFHVIAGYRHRSWQDPKKLEADRELVSRLLERWDPSKTVILGLYSDAGFGKMVRELSVSRGFGYAEFTLQWENVDNAFRELLRTCRHAALLDIADAYYLFRSPGKGTSFEDLIQRVERTNKEFFLYEEE